MIFGIGIDIIEISRMKHAIEKRHFVERVFTEKEIAYCKSRGVQALASYAARFAGKEAVLKALGTGLRGGAMTDIEILPDALGCPKVHLFRYFQEQVRVLKIGEIYISLSHAKEYAVAQAICWREENESSNGGRNA